MQTPRPAFIAGLAAALVVAAGSLAAPRVAQAIPRAQAAVPAARKALEDRVPQAAEALGMRKAARPQAGERSQATDRPLARAPQAAPGLSMPTRQLAGFEVPDFGAMLGRAEAPAPEAEGAEDTPQRRMPKLRRSP